MTLFKKKVVGLGLVLLGGLAAAHGGSTGQTWEMLMGDRPPSSGPTRMLV